MHVIVATCEPAPSALHHPLRVFLVEDSAVIRDRLAESICSSGHIKVVGHADSEADALSALSDIGCDAVVLDLQLRQGNGFNVIKSLRAQTTRRRMTFIVLTNYAIPQYRTRSLQLGADYFFDKAREYDRVREVLEELASRKDLPG
jgi:DNA-binding NarL/FixJ family response regulator